MGKSKKKTPIVKEKHRGSNKKRKAIANRKVRRALNMGKEIDSGSAYKKLVESWDICDYKFRMTKEEAIEDYKRYIILEAVQGLDHTICRFPTVEDFLNWWEKYYLRK